MRILYPFLTFTGPTHMRVHFYLKPFVASCFSQIGPFLFLDFFHSKSDEKLIKNTCYYIYIYIFPLGFIYGTYLGPLYQ